ncbi:hypothetical protein C0V70_17700 [Bacteriovorax stolpii]|uniref:Uncharacterized protein n=1 Tax=Bacteriovorax stolpii TaxID=960 RepID=A0A2K9NWM5_BACTC|nr:hypothetical protein [Bacteriovorax stolpii]AUN99906.1 hypothetical protein C0V70_17700 [Bacteriovorax stolpii]TDP54201.1 hypothetical protein C8D79_1494 [Bacteriovorax stolpii]
MKLFSLLIFCISLGVWAKVPDSEVIETAKTADGKILVENNKVWYGQGYNQDTYEALKAQIGWVYPIYSRVQHSKKIQGTQEGYDVFYDINALGQRVYDVAAPKKKHLILAGDSNTFGLGLPNEETLAALFTKSWLDYHVYNFGHGGGAPHNTLSLMENFPWDKEIKESEGQFVYIFYPNWMSMRVIGTKSYLTWDRGDSPWYALDKGKLVRKGSFNDRLLTHLLKFLSFIDVFNWIGDLPKLKASDMDLVAKILVKMNNEYLIKFPKGKFIVVISNYHETKKDYVKELDRLLKLYKIDTAFIHLNHPESPRYHLVDHHFNYEGQKMTAQDLMGVLKP